MHPTAVKAADDLGCWPSCGRLVMCMYVCSMPGVKQYKDQGCGGGGGKRWCKETQIKVTTKSQRKRYSYGGRGEKERKKKVIPP